MTHKKTLISALSLVAGLAVASVSTPAHATTVNPCVVTALNTDNASNFTLSCSGTWYGASVGTCGSTTTTIDAVKEYLSVAQAALLSGKNLVIVTNGTAGCTTKIVYMELDK